MPFRNFSIWRGRLPHWRADDVTYYVTFRHRRPLEAAERTLLLRALLRPNGSKWDLVAVRVGADDTEALFSVKATVHGRPLELAKIVEPAKAKAGKQIVARSGERFPPFYGESYDRIVRDEAELGERLETIGAKAAEEGALDTLWPSAE